jgi:cell division protein FtsN
MSNYGNYDPNDPLRREPPYDPDAKAMNAAWGWIAAAVFLVVVLAVAFGIGHQPGSINTASNDSTPPAVQHMAPPVTPAPAPGVTTVKPDAPTPITPAPGAPTPNGTGQ